MRIRASAFGPILAAALLAPASVWANPLPVEQCDKLKAELTTLNVEEVTQPLLAGPKWAKENLTEEQLARVQRFVEVEELVQFRCPKREVEPVTPPPLPAAAPHRVEKLKQYEIIAAAEAKARAEAEAKRVAEEKARQEERRIAEEKAAAEAKRVAEEKAAEEAKRLAEEKEAAEAKRDAEQADAPREPGEKAEADAAAALSPAGRLETLIGKASDTSDAPKVQHSLQLLSQPEEGQGSRAEHDEVVPVQAKPVEAVEVTPGAGPIAAPTDSAGEESSFRAWTEYFFPSLRPSLP